MLSTKSSRLDPVGGEGNEIDYDPRTRRRRLNDINRGKYYFQRLDKLADTYWNSNDPTVKPFTKTNLSPIRPITDTSYSQQYAKRRIQLLSDKHDKQMADICKRRVQSETFLLSQEYRNKNPPKKDEVLYNQWGSGHNPLEEKLKLKKEDFESRYEPFRYRDSVKHVLKPIPKKPVIMSRVANHTTDRQLKKQRNFCSENGTVQIIRPVDTLPESEEYMISYFDPDEVEKESTFVILERIDKILHPIKYNLLKERGSSVENEPPSLTDADSEISEKLYPEVKPQDKVSSRRVTNQMSLHADQALKRHNHKPVDQAWKRHNHKPVVHLRRSYHTSLTSVLEKLEMSKLDAFKKCQLWIVKCKAANWYFDQ